MKANKALKILCLAAVVLLAGCTGKKENVNPAETPDNNVTAEAEIKEETKNEEPKSTEAPSEDIKDTEITTTPSPSDSGTIAEVKDKPAKERKLSSDIEPTEKKLTEEDVVFSNEGGVYSEAFKLTLSCAKSSEIYYTTDGSDPAVSKTARKYEGPIEVKDRKGEKNVVAAVETSLFCSAFSTLNNKNLTCNIPVPSDSDVDKCTVIRACAKLSDGSYGKTWANTYFIGTAEEHIAGIKASCEAAGKPLAVISISIDFDDLFDDEKGIYVKGNVFKEAYASYLAKNPNSSADDARKVDANYSMRGREWERKIHMEMFEMDEYGATEVISTECGIRVQGNYSRSDLQKGLRLYARSSYGDKKFKYDIFGKDAKDPEGKKIKKFDTLVLRAGGNTTFQAKFNDAYWQEAVKELDLATQASRPCVVYVNGEYFGLYVLEEDYTADFFESHYGVNADNVVVYKGDAEEYSTGWKLDAGPLPKGVQEDLFLKNLYAFFNSHNNLKSQADYDAFAKLVDVDSVRDYFVTEVWMNNKWDWPGKNWVIWKTATVDETNEYADGRWRFAMLDLDFGGVSGKGEAGTNTVKDDNYKPLGLLDKDTSNPVVLMFAYLMTNEGFVRDYEQALAEIGSTTFEKEKLFSLMEKYEGSYGPLFEDFFKRYPQTGSAGEALNGGYASAKCIREFVEVRGSNIQKIINWIEKKKQ